MRHGGASTRSKRSAKTMTTRGEPLQGGCCTSHLSARFSGYGAPGKKRIAYCRTLLQKPVYKPVPSGERRIATLCYRWPPSSLKMMSSIPQNMRSTYGSRLRMSSWNTRAPTSTDTTIPLRLAATA